MNVRTQHRAARPAGLRVAERALFILVRRRPAAVVVSGALMLGG
jgi:hypothetical protein